MGPYKIVNICPFGTVQFIHLEGNIRKDIVHKDRIKKVILTAEEESKFSSRATYIVQKAQRITNNDSDVSNDRLFIRIEGDEGV